MGEILEDYDYTINYHPGKVNVVADTLNRQMQVASSMIKELHLLEVVSIWNSRLESRKMILENIVVKAVLLDRINEAQEKDSEVQKWLVKVKKGEKSDFNLEINGVLRFRKRIVVPKDERLKRKILEETCRFKYTVHSGENKMYQDLKSLYWWENMKKEIARFI